MTGTIIELPRFARPGTIQREDGRMFKFQSRRLKNATIETISLGQEVSFEDEENSFGLFAADIYVLPL